MPALDASARRLWRRSRQGEEIPALTGDAGPYWRSRGLISRICGCGVKALAWWPVAADAGRPADRGVLREASPGRLEREISRVKAATSARMLKPHVWDDSSECLQTQSIKPMDCVIGRTLRHPAASTRRHMGIGTIIQGVRMLTAACQFDLLERAVVEPLGAVSM